MSPEAPRKLLDDCFLHDSDRLRHADALALLKDRVRPVAGKEIVKLADANGRILGQTITAPRPIPATDNSAVDGYTFSHGDYLKHGGRLPVSDRVVAGHPATKPLAPGTAARIFTGAVMPENADTIVMQEDTMLVPGDPDMVVVPDGLKMGANCRKAGEDLAEGDIILDIGTRLRPQDVAAIASTGLDRISCFAPLKLALVSTGDEILRPGAAFSPGKVYDANFFLLRGLLESLGVEIIDLGILEDKAETVRDALENAAATHDAILTTGGASRGEEDHVVKSVDALGSLHMWQLAIKPGRPMAFGQIGDCIFLGLPGNPVAAMVCFLLYVRPVLLRLGGADWQDPVRYEVPATFAMTKKPGRREFLRGIVEQDPGGVARVKRFPRDGSGLISSLRLADGLIEIGEDVEQINPGDPVWFLPFPELGVAPR
jgi:molybdopterin molybdotransferase